MRAWSDGRVDGSKFGGTGEWLRQTSGDSQITRHTTKSKDSLLTRLLDGMHLPLHSHHWGEDSVFGLWALFQKSRSLEISTREVSGTGFLPWKRHGDSHTPRRGIYFKLGGGISNLSRGGGVVDTLQVQARTLIAHDGKCSPHGWGPWHLAGGGLSIRDLEGNAGKPQLGAAVHNN